MSFMRRFQDDFEYISEASPDQLEVAFLEYTEVAGPLPRLIPRISRSKLFRGVIRDKQVAISVIPDGRNSFTPFIEARIEPYGDHGSRVVGVVGPHQLVVFFLLAWSMIVFSAAVLVVGFTLLAVLSGGAAPPPFVILPPLVMLGFPILLLKLGKRVGEEPLRRGVNDVLEYAEFLRTDAIERGAPGEVVLDLEDVEVAQQQQQARRHP